MDTLRQEFVARLPDAVTFTRLSLRLGLAAVLGAIVGYDRERMGKPAGLRTQSNGLARAWFDSQLEKLGRLTGFEPATS